MMLSAPKAFSVVRIEVYLGDVDRGLVWLVILVLVKLNDSGENIPWFRCLHIAQSFYICGDSSEAPKVGRSKGADASFQLTDTLKNHERQASAVVKLPGDMKQLTKSQCGI